MNNQKIGFFEALREFFFADEGLEGGTEVQKETTENETESTIAPVEEKETSLWNKKLSILGFTATMAAFFTIIPLCVYLMFWSSAGEYSKNILKHITLWLAVSGGVLGFLFSFVSSLPKEAWLIKEAVSKLLSLFLLVVVYLGAVVGFGEGVEGGSKIYSHVPFGSQIESKVEDIKSNMPKFNEDLRVGAYKLVDTIDAEITQITQGTRNSYYYSMTDSHGNSVVFYDYGDILREIFKENDIGDGEAIEFPVSVIIEVREKDGEQYYFYGSKKFNGRIS